MATDQEGSGRASNLEHILSHFGEFLGISPELQAAIRSGLEAGHEFDDDHWAEIEKSSDGLRVPLPSREEFAQKAAVSAELQRSTRYRRARRAGERARTFDQAARALDRCNAIEAMVVKRLRRPNCSARPRAKAPSSPPLRGSRRDSSSSRTSGTDPGSEDEPELPTGPGALCHCGCGETLPANKRPHARWVSDAHRKRFTRNAPEQREPRRDTREPEEIHAEIERAVARRAALWRQPTHALAASPDQRRELADLEAALNGERGLWAEARIAVASRLALASGHRRLPGAPVEARAVSPAGEGSAVGKSSLAETAAEREARLNREAEHGAAELHRWRERKGFVEAVPPSGTLPERGTVVELATWGRPRSWSGFVTEAVAA